MPDRRRRILMLLVWGAVFLGACAREDGPEPIAYDRQPCAYCRMLISEPGFAAQLQTVDHETLSFDDPGCLMRYQAERAPQVRAIWFHHAHEDRWLSAAAVGFVRVPHSPMAYDLGAVDASTDGALPLSDAVQRVRHHGDAHRSAADAPG